MSAGQIPKETSTRGSILDAALKVFGRFGYKKTSLAEVARAAGLSKQGLYLHFRSKELLFKCTIQKYLDDGLQLVGTELAATGQLLTDRITTALDVWFGRHFSTFDPDSFDVLLVSSRTFADETGRYKKAFKKKVADAIREEKIDGNCTPEEYAEVLFTCGLSWKEGFENREAFRHHMKLCVKAILGVESKS